MKKGKKRNGFTIIEASLVLAIAGLIFLMVFIAFPALNRSQRDSKRRDDILLFLEAVKKYQTNNRGALPNELLPVTVSARPISAPERKDTWAGFYWSYLDNSFLDPVGNAYALDVKKCGGSEGGVCKNSPVLDAMDYTLHVLTEATCSDENAAPTSNPRNIAVIYRLESSGVYCANT